MKAFINQKTITFFGDRMINGAVNALKVVLSLKSGENVLVVSDEKKNEIGKAFMDGAKQLGANVRNYVLPEDRRPLKKIPDALLKMVDDNNIIINAFEGFPEETPFRIKLIKKEISTNARVGHAPGITRAMMTRGPMTTDYEKVAENAYSLISKFKNAKNVHITAPGGTDIILDIENRGFDSDVKIKPGTFGNLPAGEIWCAPVENKANGVIVTDGSIGDIGQVKKPLRIEVENGKIVSLQSDDPWLVEKIKKLTSVDKMASVIGELGIGLNPNARITGNLLEDEKAGKTAHIAFGNNEEMSNGKNNSKTHRDFLFYKPTLKVTYKDGNEKIVIKDGDVI
ncbi:MAG: aminopeptidase [Thermoplasmatales archaeon]|nr:aminopeptidase [Thermoplasmatales archaeon]